MKDKNKFIILYFIIVVAIGMLVTSVQSYIKAYCNHSNTVTVGVIEDSRKRNPKEGKMPYIINYSYTVDETIYYGEDLRSDNMHKGQKIKVYYNKCRPEKSGIVAVDVTGVMFGFILLGVGIVSFAGKTETVKEDEEK